MFPMTRVFIERLPAHFVATFRGKNLLWHALAIALTYVCVSSGFDWWYFEHTRIDALLSLALSAAIVGFFTPVITPVALYVYGEWYKNTHAKKIGAALAQAALMGWVVSSFYKIFTGRLQPEFMVPPASGLPEGSAHIDISNQFNFGFWEHGIFWGWPSSHTTVAFAMAAALITLYPRHRLVVLLSFIYAFYIGLGVSVSVHWFSDFVAGAIIGTVIGAVVGKSIIRQNW